MASPKRSCQPRQTIDAAGSREVRDFIGKLTVRRALALLAEADLPRRRLDSLLLLASGLTPGQTSKQTGVSKPEVIRLKDTALGLGIAHALLFGKSRPASAIRRLNIPTPRQRTTIRPRNHATHH